MTALRGLALSLIALAAGCATATPMLTPVRVLRDGKIALDLGSAYSAPVWSPALTDAQGANVEADTVLRAAVTHGATPPGVVTYAAGRGGFGHSAEGSIALIGRVVRIGARRELYHSGNVTLAGGLAGRFAFISGAYEAATPRLTVDTSRLYGGDLSLALGYSRRDIYDLWVAVRGGYLYNDAAITLAPTTTQPDARAYALGAHRVEVGVNLGMRVAFGHFGAGVELETVIAYATGEATWSGGSTTQSGVALSLVPAGAVSYQF